MNNLYVRTLCHLTAEGGREGKTFCFSRYSSTQKILAIGVVEVSLTEPFVFVPLFLSDWLRLLVREVSFATALIVGISFVSRIYGHL